MFMFLNEREERTQGGNLKELKYFSDFCIFSFLQIKTANFLWLGSSFYFGGEFRKLAKILMFTLCGTMDMC